MSEGAGFVPLPRCGRGRGRESDVCKNVRAMVTLPLPAACSAAATAGSVLAARASAQLWHNWCLFAEQEFIAGTGHNGDTIPREIACHSTVQLTVISSNRVARGCVEYAVTVSRTSWVVAMPASRAASSLEGISDRTGSMQPAGRCVRRYADTTRHLSGADQVIEIAAEQRD